MTGGRGPVIRTPDQRIRVFVSSTLLELADERRAARSAIERLRMAPVMFDSGARPHARRELSPAYLEQSDIFIGIYAREYGATATDEEISELQDEYDLVPRGTPKLIYLKDASDRDARLTTLISRIRADDEAAYTSFEDAGELEDLVLADLAMLLT